jgi:hypothetical protein
VLSIKISICLFNQIPTTHHEIIQGNALWDRLLFELCKEELEYMKKVQPVKNSRLRYIIYNFYPQEEKKYKNNPYNFNKYRIYRDFFQSSGIPSILLSVRYGRKNTKLKIIDINRKEIEQNQNNFVDYLMRLINN